MSKMINLTGQRFGRLVVLERVNNDSHNATQWLCECDCGKKTVVCSNSLRSGKTQSCGCLQRELSAKLCAVTKTVHGHRHTRLYAIWCGMKQRCYNLNSPAYKNYGGNGITICDEWLKNFQAFHEWAITHGYQENMTIDRIDNSKGYEPDNCRWATSDQQNKNKRTVHLIEVNGEYKTIPECSKLFGVPREVIYYRLHHGWDEQLAIKKPSQRKK